MRTTLTLEPDVAIRLKREARRRGGAFKDTVNDALRAGLDALTQRAGQGPAPFAVEPFNLGGSRLGSLDNVEEVLSRVEGEEHR